MFSFTYFSSVTCLWAALFFENFSIVCSVLGVARGFLPLPFTLGQDMRSTALILILFLAHFSTSIAQEQFSRNLESFLQKFSMITVQMSGELTAQIPSEDKGGLTDRSLGSWRFPSSRGKTGGISCTQGRCEDRGLSLDSGLSLGCNARNYRAQ